MSRGHGEAPGARGGPGPQPRGDLGALGLGCPGEHVHRLLGSSSLSPGTHLPGVGSRARDCSAAGQPLPALPPKSCAAAGPQSGFSLCCWADKEVSVPSGKTERVFLAVTQALEEAAALLPPASPSEGERQREAQP